MNYYRIREIVSILNSGKKKRSSKERKESFERKASYERKMSNSTAESRKKFQTLDSQKVRLSQNYSVIEFI